MTQIIYCRDLNHAMDESILDSSRFPYLKMQPGHWEIVKEILERNVQDLEVWAFGSRVILNEISIVKVKEYSDLDLAIISVNPMGFVLLSKLNEEFRASELPYKVDVVEWLTTSDSFKKIIELGRIVIQEPT